MDDGGTLVVQAPQRRLDVFVVSRRADLSRARVQRLISEGCITVNDALARASTALETGDMVRVRCPSSAPVGDACVTAPAPLSILYEDDQVIVVDKPAGLVVHDGRSTERSTLAHLLVQHRPAMASVGGDPERAGLVHRLDRDTSGVMVAACTEEALRSLQGQFQMRQVEKVYLALVHGHVSPERAAIDAPLGRDPAERTRQAVVAEGRYARSEYLVVERLRDCSLLKVRILTGRTHQVRAHLAAIGHPLVGDRVYGPKRSSVQAARQFLHAQRLAFRHPSSGEAMHFEAPLPGDLQAALALVRQG